MIKTRCIFCWDSNGSVPFIYNGRSYVAHPECLSLWEETKRAIHSGEITHSVKLRFNHPCWLYYEQAQAFFHHLRWQDPNALFKEPDYLKFTD